MVTLCLTKEARIYIGEKIASSISGPVDFPVGAVVKNLPANSGDMDSSPGLGGSHMLWSN